METLLGLVLLISSIVALVKFNRTTASVAKGAESKAQVWAEEMVQEASLKRQTNYEEFIKHITLEDGTKRKIISHDSFMKILEGE